MPGKLFIVPTPVGNLGDMTPRAVEVLREASLILAEDTRTSAVLMKHFGIATPMASHHKYNEHQPLDPILDRIEAGESIALVSDAGTPVFQTPVFCFLGSVVDVVCLSKRCRGLRLSCRHWSIRGCRAINSSSKASCRLKRAGLRALNFLPNFLSLL